MIENKFQNLEELKNFLENKGNFEKFNFPEIARSASKLVFSKGNPESKILIIGEAPGADEDAQGIPFCGRCGKLLEKALMAHNINQNKDLYTMNSVFWRPTFFDPITKRLSNRAPSFEEIEWCRPFVFEHLRLLKPEKIICLGATSFFAIQNLDEKERKNIKISQLIGQIFSYSQNPLIKVYVNFHPAYILRNEKTLFKKYSDDLGNFILQNNN